MVMGGQVLLVNIRNVPYDLIVSEDVLRLFLVRAVEKAGMTPVLHTLQVAHFPAPVKGVLRGGFGISAGMILVESHIYIHTWAEDGYIRFELSSCKNINVDAVISLIKTIFGDDVKIDYVVVPWLTTDGGAVG